MKTTEFKKQLIKEKEKITFQIEKVLQESKNFKLGTKEMQHLNKLHFRLRGKLGAIDTLLWTEDVKYKY